jgi:hypothetical protein
MNDRYGQPNGGYGGGNDWHDRNDQGFRPNGYGNPYQQPPPQRGPGPAQMYSNGPNGMNGGSQGEGRRPSLTQGVPSPPRSISQSSDGATMYSTIDGASARKGPVLEETLQKHYEILHTYLEPVLAQERASNKPTKARDKLLRLSSAQFQELSTDVFDELQRRQGQENPRNQGDAPPYLLPKDTFHPKRNQARQKLSTLQPTRFRDLAADVFFELERRFPKFVHETGRNSPTNNTQDGRPISNKSNGSFGLPGAPNRPGQSEAGLDQGRGINGGPKGGPPFPRRQPGGSISNPFNQQTNGPNGEYGRPTPKTFQSNTIVPNISTMVEDDDDQSATDDHSEGRGPSFEVGRLENGVGLPGNIGQTRDGPKFDDPKLQEGYENQISDLKKLLEAAEKALADSEENVARLKTNEAGLQDKLEREQADWGKTKVDLQNKLADAADDTESFRSDLERLKTERTNMERELRTQLEKARSGSSASGAIKEQLDALERENSELKADLQQQQQHNEDVRREAAGFLKEMQTLSRGGQNWEREEQLVADVTRYQEEAKLWKSRYTRARTQIRTLKASSIGLSMQPATANAIQKDATFTDPDGLVKDIHVTKFQISIDELLRAARTSDSSMVLDQMKIVVVSVRSITHSVPDLPPSEGPLAQERSKIKSRVSATANNLITASKNFVASNGISPVSLLDAAASHLTAAVIDLVRTVKIKPTPAGELEDEEDDIPLADSPSLFSMRNGRLSGESVYSSLSSRGGRPDKQSWLSRGSPTRATPNGRGFEQNKLSQGLRRRDSTLEELKVRLEYS